MVSPLYIVLIVIVLIESSTGITLNMCIFIFNLLNLKRMKKFKPHDLIHLSKGLVNTLLQLFWTFEIMVVLVWFEKFFVKEVYLTCFICLSMLARFDYWLTTFLCAYYCSTISNIHFVFFIWLKRSIATFLPRLLLIGAIGSFLLSFLSIWETSMTLHEQPTWNGSNDSKIVGGMFYVNPYYNIPVMIFGCYLPFILSFIFFMVTLFSLVRHICKIKGTNVGMKGPKLYALVNATRTMLLLLVVHVMFFLFGLISVSSVSISMDMKSIFSWFLVMFCPTAEALTMIQGSSKLRRMFQVIFPAKSGIRRTNST